MNRKLAYACTSILGTALCISCGSINDTSVKRTSIPNSLGIGENLLRAAPTQKEFTFEKDDLAVALLYGVSHRVYSDPTQKNKTIVELTNSSEIFGISKDFGCHDRLAPVYYYPHYIAGDRVEVFAAIMRVASAKSQGVTCTEKPKFVAKIVLDGEFSTDKVRMNWVYGGLKYRDGQEQPAANPIIPLPDKPTHATIISPKISNYRPPHHKPIPGAVIDRLPGGFELDAEFQLKGCSDRLGPVLTYSQMPRTDVNGVTPAAEIVLFGLNLHSKASQATPCHTLPTVSVTLPSMGSLEAAKKNGINLISLDKVVEPKFVGYEALPNEGSKLMARLDVKDKTLPMSFLAIETLHLGSRDSFSQVLCFVPNFDKGALREMSADEFSKALDRLKDQLNASSAILQFISKVEHENPSSLQLDKLSRSPFGGFSLVYTIGQYRNRIVPECSERAKADVHYQAP